MEAKPLTWLNYTNAAAFVLNVVVTCMFCAQPPLPRKPVPLPHHPQTLVPGSLVSDGSNLGWFGPDNQVLSDKVATYPSATYAPTPTPAVAAAAARPPPAPPLRTRPVYAHSAARSDSTKPW